MWQQRLTQPPIFTVLQGWTVAMVPYYFRLTCREMFCSGMSYLIRIFQFELTSLSLLETGKAFYTYLSKMTVSTNLIIWGKKPLLSTEKIWKLHLDSMLNRLNNLTSIRITTFVTVRMSIQIFSDNYWKEFVAEARTIQERHCSSIPYIWSRLNSYTVRSF